MADLRRQLFVQLQRLSIPFFDVNPVGRLMTRVTSDVETLNEVFSSGLVTVFGDVFTLVAIMVMMLVTEWRLALVAFVVIPLVLLTVALFRRQVRSAFRDIRIRLARLNSYLQEQLSGMRVVQLFGRERPLGRDLRPDQPGASRGAPPVDHRVRPVLPGHRTADGAGPRPPALVRRHPFPALDAHHRRPGGIHPAHPPLLPAAAGPLGEVQPAAERDGVVRADLHPAR